MNICSLSYYISPKRIQNSHATPFLLIKRVNEYGQHLLQDLWAISKFILPHFHVASNNNTILFSIPEAANCSIRSMFSIFKKSISFNQTHSIFFAFIYGNKQCGMWRLHSSDIEVSSYLLQILNQDSIPMSYMDDLLLWCPDWKYYRIDFLYLLTKLVTTNSNFFRCKYTF